MAEGVAEIEERPAPLGRQLPLVRLDDPRLDRAAAADDPGEAGGSPAVSGARSSSGEELRVAEQPRLDHLGHARRELARRAASPGTPSQ